MPPTSDSEGRGAGRVAQRQAEVRDLAGEHRVDPSRAHLEALERAMTELDQSLRRLVE